MHGGLTGAEGGPIVRMVKRVCGRHRRSQFRRCVAIRAPVPWATSSPRGLEHKPSYLEAIAASAERAAIAEKMRA